MDLYTQKEVIQQLRTQSITITKLQDAVTTLLERTTPNKTDKEKRSDYKKELLSKLQELEGDKEPPPPPENKWKEIRERSYTDEQSIYATPSKTGGTGD
jgi:hypothetical protein